MSALRRCEHEYRRGTAIKTFSPKRFRGEGSTLYREHRCVHCGAEDWRKVVDTERAEAHS